MVLFHECYRPRGGEKKCSKFTKTVTVDQSSCVLVEMVSLSFSVCARKKIRAIYLQSLNIFVGILVKKLIRKPILNPRILATEVCCGV